MSRGQGIRKGDGSFFFGEGKGKGECGLNWAFFLREKGKRVLRGRGRWERVEGRKE